MGYILQNIKALELSTYGVELKSQGIQLWMEMNFRDDKGNIVLITKANPMVKRQTIETPDGKVLCTVSHKIISAMPTYELHDGDVNGNIIGIIKQEANLKSLLGINLSIALEDSNKNVMATAKGDFTKSEFAIINNNGDIIAKVTKNYKGTVWDKILSAYLTNAYVLNIIKKEVPTITLLGFLVVLEYLIMGHVSPGSFY